MKSQIYSVAAAVLILNIISCSPAQRDVNRAQPPKIDNAVQNKDTPMTTEKAAQLEAEKMVETYENQEKQDKKTKTETATSLEKCPSGIKVPDTAKNKIVALTFDQGLLFQCRKKCQALSTDRHPDCDRGSRHGQPQFQSSFVYNNFGTANS
jgi:hypothetical protein